jgi:GNAT superfamily N-acetyltransferase
MNDLSVSSSIPFSVESPTLTISELVLSYLVSQNTDKLLQWYNSNIGKAWGSAFVALEPMGYYNESSKNGAVSVADGYRRDYSQKFRDKMEKGRAKAMTSKIDENASTSAGDISPSQISSSFHPLGASLENITDRLKEANFLEVYSATVGMVSSIAAACTSSKSFDCPEVFDEHAAFALHMQSYSIVCGFSSANQKQTHQKQDDCFFRRTMCPWESPNALQVARSSLPILDFEKGIVYTEIQLIDEDPVRDLFEGTYKEYMAEYPAIRKMVKGVLNKDLRRTRMDTITGNVCDTSAIAQYYRLSKGIFLVAVCYDSNARADGRPRKVIGCVGVRSCEAKNVTVGTMEVFRLAVDLQYRNRGVAKNLLLGVESYAKDQGSPKLIANTLTILQSASNLYQSCGYVLEEENALGEKLSLTTFVKNFV